MVDVEQQNISVEFLWLRGTQSVWRVLICQEGPRNNRKQHRMKPPNIKHTRNIYIYIFIFSICLHIIDVVLLVATFPPSMICWRSIETDLFQCTRPPAHDANSCFQREMGSFTQSYVGLVALVGSRMKSQMHRCARRLGQRPLLTQRPGRE